VSNRKNSNDEDTVVDELRDYSGEHGSLHEFVVVQVSRIALRNLEHGHEVQTRHRRNKRQDKQGRKYYIQPKLQIACARPVALLLPFLWWLKLVRL